jgi:hypothetical protein
MGLSLPGSTPSHPSWDYAPPVDCAPEYGNCQNRAIQLYHLPRPRNTIQEDIHIGRFSEINLQQPLD